MKRFVVFFIANVMLLGSAMAQYYYIPTDINPNGNPGGLNNDVEEPYGFGLPAGWTDIDPMSNTPAWTAVQTIPFPFQFNGQTVTQYKVSNTGILTFTPSAGTPPGPSSDILPNANIPDKSVCIWGLAWTGGTKCNDRIVTKTFGTAPQRQHWIQFNSYNKTGQNTKSCYYFFSIVLEETTNNIYIVDQRRNSKGCQIALAIGIQINSSTAIVVNGSPNLNAKAGSSKTPIDNKYYTFIKGTPPTKDVGISWLQMGNFVILNAGPFDVKGKVKNYTATPVTSYDMNYSVNNGPPVTCHLSGAAFNIPGYGEEWFIHSNSWMPPDTGVYHFKYWASNINGGPDENNSNDTMYKTVEVSHAFTPKLRLFEEFTSSTDLASKDGNIVLKSVLDEFPDDYALIKYPMNYPDAGDPYYTQECGTRQAYYGVDSLPDMYVNGRIIDPLYFDSIQYVELWDKSYMMFNPTHTRNGNTFTVTASILPFENFTSGNFVVRFAIVEKTTTGNKGTNGETVFYNTFRKFIPDAAGVSLGQLQKAVFKTVTQSYTFPAQNSIEDFNNLQVIVFVQDEGTKQVMQTSISEQMSSIDENSAQKNILAVFPNPANDYANVQYLMTNPGTVNIELLSATGKTIKKVEKNITQSGVFQEVISTSTLPKGLYYIRLHNDNISETSKLIIQ